MIKILIVDDDQSLQRLYGLILKDAGFEIIGTAINGKDAIEKYTTLEGKTDLILMDHRMPIKNGLDAMVEILKINKKEKIIFASADISVKQKAISLGAVAFLDKPFKMQQLLITIQKIVKELIIEH
ncbi:MAG: two-component system response regulator [Promethearchaeota archaeon Loki_b32]|nr:MAG: two-component system response regulator [Candidatus Lokiarchaeota archaeon Loki_b32]